MNKKILMTLSLSTLSIIPSCFSLISCTKENKQDEKKSLNQIIEGNENANEREWKNFLNRDYVKEILRLSFDDDVEAKNKYIAEQKKLNNNIEYSKKLKEALIYGNSLKASTSYNSDDFSLQPKLLFQNGKKIFNELKSKNWLWFLYNLPKIIFGYFPPMNKFESSDEQSALTAQGNSLILGHFYKPKSNEIIQYTTQVTKNDKNGERTYDVYLLTKEGFILQLTIDWAKDDEDNKIKPSVKLFGYIYTYPNIVKDRNNLNIFNIQKYVIANTESFDDINNRTLQILFQDQYGGSPLRYTIIDVSLK